MTTLRLYKPDGTTVECDVEQSQPLKISREFDRVENLKAAGDTVQEFEVPMTSRLARFLGFTPDVNNTGWVNYKKKIVSEIITDGIALIRGYVQILSHTVTGNSIVLKMKFVGQVPELIRACGEKKLKDITALDTLNYELVDDSWSDPNANTILTLCDKYGFVGQFSQGPNAIQDADYPTYIGKMTPAVKASWIFEQIIKDAGFTFNPSPMRDALDQVYVPFISDKELLTNQRYETLYFNLGQATDITGITDDTTLSLTENADNGNNVVGGVFTAPYYGTYTFKVWFHGIRTAGGGGTRLQLYFVKNGTTQEPITASFSVGQFLQGRIDSYTTQLNQGDTLQLKVVEVSGAGTYTIFGDADNNPTIGTGWELESVSSPWFGSGVNVIMRDNAPDIRQTDFLRGIFNAFKCAIVPDPILPNTLTIEPIVDYIGSGDSVDWTPLLDTSQPIQVTPTTELQAKLFTITYKADSDATNEYYTKQLNRTFGRFEVNESNLEQDEINDFATDEQRIELPFGATPCDEINGTDIIAPKFISASGDFVLPTCRLLYKAGTCNVNTINDTFTPVIRSPYLLSNYSAVVPDIDSLDLNFGIEVPLHKIFAQPFQTLWYRYWSRYYRELYSKDARILEAQFDLNSTEVRNINFNDKIFIENDTIGTGYWRLLNIYDFDPEGTKTTRCRLIKILNLGLDCDQVPFGRDVDGQILFGPGPSNGSQKCCVKYGHVWDAEQEKCFRRQLATPNSTFATQFVELETTRARTVNVTGNYNITPNDAVVNVDTSADSVNVYLPLASSHLTGRVTVAHSAGTGSVTVFPYKAEKVADKTSENIGSKGNQKTFTAEKNGWTI